MKVFIRKITVILPALLLTLSCGLGGDMASRIDEYNTELVVTVTSVTSAVAVFNNTEYTITITSSEPGTTIKYTTDGSDPSRTNGTEYTGFVTVNSPAGNVEIKAVIYDVNRISTVQSVTVTVGDGSVTYPYEIATPDQLYYLSTNIASYTTSYFLQVADIDLSAYNTGIGWPSIGTFINPFTGSFNGNNYTIYNLLINNSATDYQGLFGYVSGTLQNINLTDANVTGKINTGALVGCLNGTAITNCTVSGTSSVTGESSVGGLVGYSYDTTITGCNTNADVEGTSNAIGGFIGLAQITTVTGCYTKGDVTITGSTGADNAGGFIGNISTNDCQVIISFARGDVISTNSSFNRIGGFAGTNFGTITNCYSTGDVQSAGADYGGFSGYTGAGSVITNCYSVGVLTGSGTNDGGFIGAYVAGSFTSCYWLQDGAINFGLTDASSGDLGAQVIPETVSNMKVPGTYSGWSFGTVWDISAGYYPYMIYETWDFPF